MPLMAPAVLVCVFAILSGIQSNRIAKVNDLYHGKLRVYR